MLFILLWQPRRLAIYWHQRMPMEKRNPPKLAFHFILHNKLMKCWKALTGLWIQRKRHLKWFIEWVYLAPSRFLGFLRLHICVYPRCCLLSFAEIKEGHLEDEQESVSIYYTYDKYAVLSANVSLPFKCFYVSCVFFLIGIFLFQELRNQHLWYQLWSKICEPNDKKWYCQRNLCLLRPNISISRNYRFLKTRN